MRDALAVCSWSLRPDSPEALVRAMDACGIARVQLALDPIRRGDWDVDATRRALDDAGIAIVSGMMEMAGEDYATLQRIEETGGVRPDATWAENLAAAQANARLAADLGLGMVTFHAGFMPSDPGHPEHAVILERIAAVADAFAARDVAVALETGQETADTLVGVLEALGRDDLGVNFDPANMILYGKGEPVAAIRRLGPWVRQVHLKDATPTSEPGTWGTETRLGDGAVDWPAFLAARAAVAPHAALVIEREGGDARVADVRHAAAHVGPLLEAAR